MLTTFFFALFALITVPSPSIAQSEPAEQYRELMEAYNPVAGAFRSEATDQQRKSTVERMDEFPGKFLDLADTHPTDPVALQALRQAVQAVISVDSAANHAWEVNREAFPVGSRGGSAGRIVELLLRDHLQSPKLAPICDRMRWGARLEFERFLEAALETNPDKDVRGMACLALAQLKHTHLRMRDLIEAQPDLAERYDLIFGTGFTRTLQHTDRPMLVSRIEDLYERAIEFDDVINIPFQSTIAERATTELYDLRYLSVGKPAPEIAGRDQHGQSMTLNEYRGKVVLLYFWSEY